MKSRLVLCYKTEFTQSHLSTLCWHTHTSYNRMFLTFRSFFLITLSSFHQPPQQFDFITQKSKVWADSAFVGIREEVESTLMGSAHEHIIIAAAELSVWCLCFSRVALAALWTERLSWWTLNIPSDHGILPNSLHDAARAHKVAVQLITHIHIHTGAHQHTHFIKTCTHTYWPSDLWTFCVWVCVSVCHLLPQWPTVSMCLCV